MFVYAAGFLLDKISAMQKRYFLIICLLGLSTSFSPAEEAGSSLADINDAMAFLAGMELPHRQDNPLTLTATWKTHAKQFGSDFEGYQERMLFPMSEWSTSEINSVEAPGKVVRYLFSGPDILHAFYMFPTAETFILCGLEPVGQAPDITVLNEANAGFALDEVRNALGEIINLSFFRTKDMKDDLQFATFQGTTPLMLIFLARSGQYLKDFEFYTLQKDGTLLSQGSKHSGANVVRIDFSPRRIAQTKTLYYFSSDLSDGGFDSTGFATWISAQPKGNSYLKAASFLMHDSWFTKVRNNLLDFSYQIVEDDSGIPYRYFDEATWEPHLYGVYTGPIELFANSYQSDLVAAYGRAAKPLNFGTGYKWRKGESNLMRFVLRELPAMPKEEPAIVTQSAADGEITDPPAETSLSPQTTSGE